MGFSPSLAAGLGIILSAETLILLGNGVGQAGIWFLIFLIAGAALHLLGAFTIFAVISGPLGETRFLQKNFGKWAALLLPLCSRLSLTLVAATGLVVTAGFVFNEVFVYWFPNFLFAYLLLGLILVVNLLGRVAWGRFQNFVILVTLLGLIALIISGLFLSPPPMDTPDGPESSPSLLQVALVAVLLPVGYDLAVFANGEDSGGRRKSPAVAIVLGSLILLLWGLVSLHWVSPSALIQTTIPYTVAARNILGQGGRIIMGIVILAGTAGAVNSLFGCVSRMMSAMASAGILPPVFGDKWFKGRFAPVFLTAAAATMLFTGMAGSPHLDAFLRGSLILWLFHYAALHFAYFEDRRHETFRWYRKLHLAVAILLTLIGLGLLVTDAERAVVGAYMFVCVGSMLILLLIWSGLTRTPDQD